MATPRKLVVSGGDGIYHCVSRCVRRAFLCGFDRVSGKNYDHRKEWVRGRLEFLVQVFTIEVLAYALMDNHEHTMLRLRSDLLKTLSDEEIVRRWLTLYPKKKIGNDLESDEAKAYIINVLQDEARIAILRERLGSISWFMKSLNEYIARKANKEDGCKGRFWEGRFKCSRLETEAAVLSCAVYIDLNPIRAGSAKTPETSKYTSAYERIHSLTPDSKNEPPLWIAPVQDNEKRRGFLSLSLREYLSVLDLTGRELQKGKRGSIPLKLEPILVRLGIRPTGWLTTVRALGRRCSYSVGDERALNDRASKTGKRWLKGLKFVRMAFA